MHCASCLDTATLRACLREDDDVVVLQTGFGSGRAFLRAWQTWRDHGTRAGRLHFIAITADPPSADVLRDSHQASALSLLAGQLADAWPPLTPDLHRLDFEDGNVSLLLAVGAAAAWLPELRAEVRLFVIDEFDMSCDPQRWAQRLCKALARLARPGAEMRTLLPRATVAAALRSSGFTVTSNTAQLVTQAHYAPAFQPRGKPPRPAPAPDERQALIVGAGLAGCAAAWALAQLGWTSTLVDRHGRVAAEASGNFAGLFHGVVHAQDGAHARFNRAAALSTQHLLTSALHEASVEGRLEGVLRVQSTGIGVHTMREQLARLGLPADYAQALDAAQASERCGVELRHPAWFFPGGGWLRPATLAKYFLQQSGERARLHEAANVHSIHRDGGLWHLLDHQGRPIARSAVLVLAGACDSLRLAGCAHWPVRRMRGQLSLYAPADAVAPAARPPRIALAGEGYVLPEIDGTMLFGASAQPDDDEPNVREADHAWNLARLQRLCPQAAPPSTQALTGRVAWRCVSNDRLPIIGAAPDETIEGLGASIRLQHAPRREGLYLFTALGSRGISWAVLGARLLAAQMHGAPLPLAASLAERLDPARFMQRRLRQLG